jgi:WD40 repeat protein
MPLAECNALALEGTTVWLAGGDGRAYALDMEGMRIAHSTSASVPSSPSLHAVAVAPKARLLFGGGEGGAVQVWDARSSRAVSKLTGPEPCASGAWTSALTVDEDGNWLTTAGGCGPRPRETGLLGVWHVPSRTMVGSANPSQPIYAIT